jgi:hypothetical protein
MLTCFSAPCMHTEYPSPWPMTSCFCRTRRIHFVSKHSTHDTVHPWYTSRGYRLRVVSERGAMCCVCAWNHHLLPSTFCPFSKIYFLLHSHHWQRLSLIPLMLTTNTMCLIIHFIVIVCAWIESSVVPWKCSDLVHDDRPCDSSILYSHQISVTFPLFPQLAEVCVISDEMRLWWERVTQNWLKAVLWAQLHRDETLRLLALR